MAERTTRMFLQLKKLGPGLLFAATAVGVSHLVQSTRAGAKFGLTLSALIVLACIIKYPAFRFGSEYSAYTGESVIAGYERQGRWLLVLVLLATIIEGVGVIPAVGLVTAGLSMNLLTFNANAILVTMIIVLAASIVLLLGRYKILENITRVFVVVFSVLTVVAAVAAATKLANGQPLSAPFDINEQNLFFSVSIAGWMPVGLSCSIFLSLWVIARGHLQGRPVTPEEARFDFNVGYITTLLLALCFLLMGTALLFNSGTEIAESSVGFAAQLVSLFTQSIGQWAQLVVGVAALAVMLSTVLAVVDGFPRVYANIVYRLMKTDPGSWDEDRLYQGFLGLQTVTTFMILVFLLRSFGTFIDFITALGFMAAPIIAFLNHRIMFSVDLAATQRPAAWLRYWSVAGITVLTVVFPIYLYFQIT